MAAFLRPQTAALPKTADRLQLATPELRPGEGEAEERAAVPSRGSTGRRLVVVSNRLPSVAGTSGSTGGLSSSVQAALRESGGIWFGWSGHVLDEAETIPHVVRSGSVQYAALDLTTEDYEQYYNGYANRVLWPLFHFRTDLVGFNRDDLCGYRRVNRKFAAAMVPSLNSSDLIWVQDYHLIPLGHELRRLGVDQPIGFFLHIPFPPPDLLRVLPNHRELMEALCAYDLVGFQTANDRRNFVDYAVREMGGEEMRNGRLRILGRTVEAGTFPIGIEVEAVAQLAASSEKSASIRRLLDTLDPRNLIIGVDRLDYSKGLLARFVAFEKLIEGFPDTRGKVTLLQIAPPTRSEVPEYMQIRRSLEAAAGHMNGRFAEFDWTPLRYLNKSFNLKTLVGFYRKSRIGLVTPLRDGMNLVAKEYVASQDEANPGVLVLSCLAGAAAELGDALVVNPFDTVGIAQAMHQALNMPLAERQQRWQRMMEALRGNDLTAWRRNYLARLAAAAEVRPGDLAQ